MDQDNPMPKSEESTRSKKELIFESINPRIHNYRRCQKVRNVLLPTLVHWTNRKKEICFPLMETNK